MRVTTQCNSHVQQRQQTNGKDKGFADMFANMAAHRHCQPEHGKHSHGRPEHGHHSHGRPEPEHSCCCRSKHPDIAHLNMRVMSFHRCGATQIKLTPEQKAELEALKKAASSGCKCLHVNEAENCPVMGELELVKFESDAKLIIIEPIPPTYPKSIYDMSAEELRIAIRKGANYATSGVSLGMEADKTYSKEEIYDRIKSAFANYLGEDFLEPFYNSERLDLEKRRLYNEAFDAFHSELRSYGVHDLTFREIRSLPNQDFDTIDNYPTSKKPEPPLYPQSFNAIAPKYLWNALDSVSFATNGIDKDLSKEEIYNRIQDIYFSYFGKDVFDEYLALDDEYRNDFNLHTSVFVAFHRDLQRYDVHNLGKGNVLQLDSYGYDVLKDKMNL